MGQTTRDAQWTEAKKRCRLSGEALAMAKEMGLNPRSLIKNIPSPRQPWKQPVEAWVREMYAKRAGRSARRGNNPGKLTRPGEASSRTSDVLADLTPEAPPVADTQAWAARENSTEGGLRGCTRPVFRPNCSVSDQPWSEVGSESRVCAL
jgi:hypothetical protein